MKASITTCNLAADAKAGSEDACAAEQWHDTVIGVVADGVGQATYGREAAERVVESFIANFRSRPRSWSAARALEEFARLANRTLYQESIVRCGGAEMVSTVAAVVLEGDELFGINAGDSRVYLCQQGRSRCLSKDHTESAAGFQHVLHNAIGLSPDLALHVFHAKISAGDTILLCSDGLNVLSDQALESLLADHSSARTFVSSAREISTAETMDDTTAVVLNVTDASPNRNQSLEVPGALRAGQVHDGCELVRPLNPTQRAWIARREGREVVVKFAPEQARDNEAVHDQFAREIWSVTRFKADFFIGAYVPPENRTFCYCMEYLQVPTLKELLSAGPLPVPEAVALAGFLLDAAQFFFANDLVHGDIKPENILVIRETAGTRFKLIDFGSVTEIFSVTSRAGTPSFLAPERFHGAPISERTEIFSIGVTLFLALSGKYPYGEIEPFQTPVFRSPPRLTRLNPHLPAWLESVALRAVAVVPDDRYHAYSEMKFDLANPEKVRPWFRKDTPLLERNPLLFYKAGFFILLIVVLILLGLLLDRR